MCAEPTYVTSACASVSAPQRSSSGRPRIEYSSSEPCALTRNGTPVASPDGRTEQHVVCEDDVGRKERAQRGSVRLDVRVELVGTEVLQQLRLEPGVPVEDEHGQASGGQLRIDDGRATEIEVLRFALLADHDHVVAGATPFAGERTRVDVRPRAAEQVAVPEQDPHRAGALTSGGSRGRAATRPQGSRCAR